MKKTALNLVLILFTSSGCAAIVIAGASGAIVYTVTNIAYKTTSYPFSHVEAATYTTLKNMGVVEVGKKDIENGIKIIAKTPNLKIYIDLERITTKTTKISVDAQENIILKDRATATEIIEQTERILEGRK
ncbi:MAG: hypothetical protein A2073_08385 [Deltaproteobacteria bacterium GWC2_42_11]|nr:MAG: hypothetical protein A2073_08385 [Deltaproteobacteria bacterium GWC2_42_11]HBO84138.1 hypothetical protein [Deltaproteobacteria bacterium]